MALQTSVQAFSGDVEISSNLAVGPTANLFVDTVNSRVGIGTTGSASVALDVAAQHGSISIPMVQFRSNRDGNSNGDGNVLKLETGGNRGDVEVLECVAPAGQLFVVKANGNVGVGKDPTAKLDVNGTIAATTLTGSYTGTVNMTADESTNSTRYIAFTNSTSGAQNLTASSTLKWNPGTDTLTTSLLNVSGQINASTIYGTHTYHNNTQYNYYYYNTIGSDNSWRNIMQHGNQTHAFISCISYSAGYSQANSVRVLEYIAGGTSGGINRFTGSNQPLLITQGRTIKHNSGGGTIFSQFRILPFMI
mgnify:CR=1 FL=1